MSKLIEMLITASQGTAHPMGFGKPAPTAPKRAMVLVASLTPSQARNAADYTAGADAALWRTAGGAEIKSLQEKSPAKSEVPWGLWLSAGNREDIEAISRSGLDFAIFPLTAPLWTFSEDVKTGCILQVDMTTSDSVARTIGNLPADAVLVAGDPASPFVTWHHLLVVQHFASLVDKPLLFTLPQSTTDEDLQMLWEAGVDGVVADAGAAVIPTLRKQIGRLHEPPQRKKGKPGVLLPRIAPQAESPVEEEEEEGD